MARTMTINKGGGVIMEKEGKLSLYQELHMEYLTKYNILMYGSRIIQKTSTLEYMPRRVKMEKNGL